MPPRRGRNSGEGITGVELLESVQGLSSGYGIIDMVSGVPGILFPRGAITELFGPKSSSKTTLVLETIAYNQKLYEQQGKTFKVLYVDYENAVDKQVPYMKRLGMYTDPEHLTVLVPTTMQEGCQLTSDELKKDIYDMIVTDTIAAMRPKEEVENKFGETKNRGLKAKLMSEFLRNLTADLGTLSNPPAVIFLNQQYQDISVQLQFGKLYDSPSSESLKFYAMLRLQLKEISKLKEKKENPYTFESMDVVTGSVVEITAIKNKIGTPYLSSRYSLTVGVGIDIIPSVVSACIKKGLISNKGASKSAFQMDAKYYPEQGGINGMSALLRLVRTNPKMALALMEDLSPVWAKEVPKYKLRAEIKDLNVISPEDLQGLYGDDSDYDGDDEEGYGDDTVSDETPEFGSAADLLGTLNNKTDETVEI